MGFLDQFIAEDAYLALSKIASGLSLVDVLGNVYWVDSSDAYAADVDGRGAINAPFKTLAYAISKATAGNGDAIVIKPNHNETLAASVTATQDRLSIIGIPNGKLRPQFRQTAGSLNISGTGLRLSGVRLLNDLDAQATMLSVNGQGIIVDHCEFVGYDPANKRPTNVISLANSMDDLIFFNNTIDFLNGALTLTTGISTEARVSHRLQVVRNVILGTFSSYAIGGTVAGRELLIAHNRIVNLADVALSIIKLHASSNGIVAFNEGHTGFDDSGALYSPDLDGVIQQGQCACCQNFFSNLIGESAGLTPGTVAT